MQRRRLTMMLSPSDGDEAQLEELCSFLSVFLRALRRFLSNTPEQRGHVPSNSSSDDNEDEDDDDDDDIRIIAQCWEYIHWEEYKQHCSDIASQTFTAPFCTFP